MKNFIVFISLSVILAGCDHGVSAFHKTSEYELDCEKVGGSLRRCRNKEVICYMSIYDGSALTPVCNFDQLELFTDKFGK